MNAHVGKIIQILSVTQVVVVSSQHLAHVVRPLALKIVTLAANTEVAALLAPVNRGSVPFEGFLAGRVAHATLIIRFIT